MTDYIAANISLIFTTIRWPSFSPPRLSIERRNANNIDDNIVRQPFLITRRRDDTAKMSCHYLMLFVPLTRLRHFVTTAKWANTAYKLLGARDARIYIIDDYHFRLFCRELACER